MLFAERLHVRKYLSSPAKFNSRERRERACLRQRIIKNPFDIVQLILQLFASLKELMEDSKIPLRMKIPSLSLPCCNLLLSTFNSLSLMAVTMMTVSVGGG